MVESEYRRFILALRLAEEAHDGQFYGIQSEPYLLHPIRVAFAVSDNFKVVAILHDVFEDSDVVMPNWITQEERNALIALTRMEDENYDDYIERVFSAGDMAVEVKIADLKDNLSNNPPGRLPVRYLKALERLQK